MNKKIIWVLVVFFLATVSVAEAQQPKVYRVGVIHQGGPYRAAGDGLRDGLRQLGYEEGKQILLEIRDTKSDLKLVEEAARIFEREKANVIYAVTTRVTTAVKNVTSHIPIVFSVGSDPVGSGLVQSFGKPGGRLTGVQYWTTDLTGKRLEILKEILPKLSRVVTVYNPNNRSAVEAAALAREAAQQFRVKLVERHAISVEELRQRLGEIKAREVDAYFYTTDGMVTSQAQLVIDMATSKRLPTMFSEQSLVAMGGLASYGQNFHEIGRLSAKYVQKLMTGAHPRDLRVETVDKFELTFNLKTAKQIALTIPPNVLARADKVIR
ncbi:MAG TPA: ABC transporter substrate-binding protein [Candidatus Binatia bacterium]|nr:ABC transporter substrate-binding protein [Candidatus Binatia bacterium]